MKLSKIPTNTTFVIASRRLRGAAGSDVWRPYALKNQIATSEDLLAMTAFSIFKEV